MPMYNRQYGTNKMKTLLILALGLLCFLEISKVEGLICWQCFNAYGGQGECLRTGSAVKCRPGQEFCELHIRHLGNKRGTPWIEKTCKSSKSCMDNVVQNAQPAWSSAGKQIQCNGNFPSSVCRCCCSGDMCNRGKTSCLVKSTCPAIQEPRHGFVKCTAGNKVGSNCIFRCKRAFALMGASQLDCDVNGEWTNKAPTCKLLTCPKVQSSPEQGFKICTNGMNIGSRCLFSCKEGYKIYGKSVSTCIDDNDGDEFGVWSIMQPVCKPKQCYVQIPMYHGNITCTNQNFVGSTCTFICDVAEKYELYPENAPTRLTCQPDEEWNHPSPCCTQPCPPFAIMDFVVILDSSSSVGADNWKIMVKFVSNFVGKFSIRDDATHVAVIKYNRRVDRKNRVTFKAFPNNKSGLLKAINALPYDNGKGTNTGRAIRFVTAMLKSRRSGNRKLARDIVLVMTDGTSEDPVRLPSIQLRKTGALVFAVPIGKINMRHIIDIVGHQNQKNILSGAVEKGFEALDDEFAADIAKNLCTQPCFNPLHNHDHH